MIEEFQYIGEWWIPQEPEKKFTGNLSYTPNGKITLELMGELGKKGMTIFEVIQGFTLNGKKITLMRCFKTHREEHMPGGILSIYDIQEILEGGHYSNIENIKFDNISIHYSHLDSWAGFRAFGHEIGKDGETIIKHKLPKPICTIVNDKIGIKISMSARHTHNITEVGIKNVTYFIIEFSKKVKFKECRRLIRILQNFLTLAIGTEISQPLLVKTSIGSEKKPNTINIFFKFSDLKYPYKQIIPQHMLFDFNKIKDRFEQFMKNWYNNYDSLETVFNLYFGTINNKQLYVDNQFLNYIIALESFHRIIFGGKYLDDKEYEKTINIILKAIPEDIDKSHRDSLKNRIKYGNEFSLRRRLKELINKFDKIVDIFNDNKNKFIEQIIITRNYLIHNTPELKSQACKGKDLIILNIKLKYLLELCILTRLGFGQDEIIELFSKHQRYKKESFDNRNRIM